MARSKIKIINTKIFKWNEKCRAIAVDLNRTQDICSHPRNEQVLLRLDVLFPKQNIWVKIPHGA